MKKRIGIFIAMIAALGMLAVTTGCRTGVGVGYRSAPPPSAGPPPWAPAHGYRAKHKYRYYRDAQVYFDTGRSLYFYLSGGTWRSSVRLPSHISIAGSYVELDMDTDTPYKFHKDVKGHYPPGQMKKKGKQGPPGPPGPPGKGKGKGKDWK
jgi:hypothetical protein